MANFIQKFLMWMGHIKPEQRIMRSVEEEIIQKDKTIKFLVQKLKSLEGQIAETKAEEQEKKEKIKKEDRNQKIAEGLREQEIELRKKELGELFSLNKFFRKLYGISVNKNEFECRSKWGKKFEIADKNDEASWKFGSLFISTKGFFVVTDLEGNVVKISPILKGLIYKPESIFNQFNRGRLLLNMDKNGDSTELDEYPEIDDYEINVPIFNPETGEYEKSEMLRKKARDLIIEKDEEIREKNKKIEALEMVVGKQREGARDLQRTNNVLYSLETQNKVDLSKAMEIMFSTNQTNLEIQRKISNLTVSKSLLESENNSLREINRKLLEEIEETGNITAMKKAEAIMKTAREFERGSIVMGQEMQKGSEKVQPQGVKQPVAGA